MSFYGYSMDTKVFRVLSRIENVPQFSYVLVIELRKVHSTDIL